MDFQAHPGLTAILTLHGQVPVGGEEMASVLRTVGAPREFASAPADHLALGAALGLLDFDAGMGPDAPGSVDTDLDGPGAGPA